MEGRKNTNTIRQTYYGKRIYQVEATAEKLWFALRFFVCKFKLVQLQHIGIGRLHRIMGCVSSPGFWYPRQWAMKPLDDSIRIKREFLVSSF